jgi:hypothetical protein
MTLNDLQSCGVHLKTKAQLWDLLTEMYPHLIWAKSQMHWQGRFAQQRHLERVVAALFEVCFRDSLSPLLDVLPTPNQGEEIKVNARKETHLQSDITGHWLELDIWLPRLNLAFEYQVAFCQLMR